MIVEKIASHDDHGAEKKSAFENQQETMNKIKEFGFARYAETLPNLKDAFDLAKNKFREDLPERTVYCMDEGTPWGIHAAGSGILLSDEDFNVWFDKARPECLTDHDDCGAKELKAKMMAEKFGIGIEDARIKVKDIIKIRAEKKGVKYFYIPKEEMNRVDFHNARVCYYDGTGEFNFAGVEGLPKGFVVSRAYSGKESSVGEVGTAAAIIFGDHGYGNDDKFLNEENPFIIVAIGRTPEEVEMLKSEISEFTDSEHSLGKKIAIDGFLAPRQ